MALGFTADVVILHPDSLLSGNERPSSIAGAKRLVKISNRAGTLCAVASDGEAYCSGLNTRGQVGDGTGNLVARGGLTRVVGNQHWETVRGSRDHSCGIDSSGSGFCWGENLSGKLGNDTIPDGAVVPYPVPVVGNHAFKELGLGLFFSCALTTGGQAWCWGLHNGLYLGVGGTLAEPASSVPVEVAGGHVFASLSVGYRHACGVTEGGDAYCWGENQNGKLGSGSTVDRGEPERVTGGQRWRRVYAGGTFTCGLTTQFAVYCWGRHDDGQLGPDAHTDWLSPQLVFPPGMFRDITVGNRTACGIRYSGLGQCWGLGNSGQLGNGKRASSQVPVFVVR